MNRRDIQSIRNFCIIAHIDHGKSTLADRMLEVTGTVEQRAMKNQLLDDMELERERGITIKARSVTMNYRRGSQEYQLNLIDTPGHVDFHYEVSRALTCCEGALLLVDAYQGVEAQTVANAYSAMEHDLTIIPVINKIDLSHARVDEVTMEMEQSLAIDPDDVDPRKREGWVLASKNYCRRSSIGFRHQRQTRRPLACKRWSSTRTMTGSVARLRTCVS